jgi:dethiobiotin synthetase
VTARGYFVTGTDTGVGKTLVSAALLQLYAEQGLRAVGMKPVAAGCEAGRLNEDVELLRAASNVEAPPELINPYGFQPAIAPHIAAQQADRRIEIPHVIDCYDQLARDADILIVEGAGGFLAPLNETETLADLAARLQLSIILVVGMRLGCLNHALLTVEAIQSRGLELAGWVANRIDPRMNCFEDNLATLSRRIPAPLLGLIPSLMPTENPISIKWFIKAPDCS